MVLLRESGGSGSENPGRYRPETLSRNYFNESIFGIIPWPAETTILPPISDWWGLSQFTNWSATLICAQRARYGRREWMTNSSGMQRGGFGIVRCNEIVEKDRTKYN